MLWWRRRCPQHPNHVMLRCGRCVHAWSAPGNMFCRLYHVSVVPIFHFRLGFMGLTAITACLFNALEFAACFGQAFEFLAWFKNALEACLCSCDPARHMLGSYVRLSAFEGSMLLRLCRLGLTPQRGPCRPSLGLESLIAYQFGLILIYDRHVILKGQTTLLPLG
jgi:hypothetical protein